MRNSIVRIVELLLRLLLPPPGRHRASGTEIVPHPGDEPTMPPLWSWCAEPSMDATGSPFPMVRPYVLAKAELSGGVVPC
ncbi:hypothetical protein [Streptomyces sp. NBRC 109706]|uniref:hypothetical protein n=1 Tax=Streptomyces sp. NBRC 109706 TaxID=1550035 RepID=UPI0007830D87|nr:hypothetical protein [Streptomyces sp. NBRC 109706]